MQCPECGSNKVTFNKYCRKCQRTVATIVLDDSKNRRKLRRYHLLNVATRDDWVCAICQKPVDPQATHWKRRATIDHIIPRSRGGSNQYSNLQLAHGYCNRKKGNTIGPVIVSTGS